MEVDLKRGSEGIIGAPFVFSMFLSGVEQLSGER